MLRDVELSHSQSLFLLDDPDFKRWWLNVRRGSVSTAHEWLRRWGRVHRLTGKLPADVARMTPKDATNMLLDLIATLEEQQRTGFYISNMVKPVKSWLEFNQIAVLQKIRIPRQHDLVRFGDERPPVPAELARIFVMADYRQRVASSIIGFTGSRPEVIGNFLGMDGLRVKDFPELELKAGEVSFSQVPAMVVVRNVLSKMGMRYSFLPEEGCAFLKAYLEFRMNSLHEKVNEESPILTPRKPCYACRTIRATSIGEAVRQAIRAAGFKWRPYVLRWYFDTRMMMAEAEGLIIRDWRQFWMGHRGDIEHTYTVNKSLPLDTIEMMRDTYARSAEKFLVTSAAPRSRDDVETKVKRQMLLAVGYSQEETEKFRLEEADDHACDPGDVGRR